jgi:hypothetical protein
VLRALIWCAVDTQPHVLKWYSILICPSDNCYVICVLPSSIYDSCNQKTKAIYMFVQDKVFEKKCLCRIVLFGFCKTYIMFSFVD